MATNIGPKIGIEGERQYKAEMANIIQQAKTLDSEMKLVTSSFSANTTAEERNAKTAKIAAEQQENQRRKVELLKQMLQKSAEVYGENDTKTLKWKESLNKAATELNVMEREGKEASGEAKDLGKNMDKTDTETKSYAKDAGKATDQTQALGKSFDTGGEKGLKFGDIIKANILSDAIKKGWQVVVDLAKKLGSALIDSVKGATAFADEILTLSTQTSIGTEKLQAYKYMAEMTDTSLETITGSMTKLTRNMASARDGSTSATAAFEALGVSFTNADGTLRDSDTVFGEIIDKLGAMPEGAERDALAMDIFGKSAQDLNPLIAAGAEGIAKWTSEAEKVGAVISEDDLGKLGALQDVFDRLSATGKALKNRLGVVLSDMLLPQFQEFTDIFQDLAAGTLSFEEFGQRVGDLILQLVGKFAEILPKALSFGFQMLESIVLGLWQALPAVAAELPRVLTSVLKFILSALPQVLDAALTVVETLALGISKALPTLIPAAISAVVQLVKTIVSHLPLVISAALELIKGLASGLIEALPVLLGELPGLVVSIVDTILDMIPLIIDCGTELLNALLDNADVIIGTWADALPYLITGLIDSIMENLPKIAESGFKLLSALVDKLPGVLKYYVTEAFPGFWSKIFEYFKNQGPELVEIGKNLLLSVGSKWGEIFGKLWGQIKEIGGNLLKGLWEGIKSVKDWLWQKVKGMLSGLTDKIKGFFGIRSPSKLFEDEIGVKLAKGIGVGFDDEMPDVTKQMNAAMPTALDTSVTNFGGVAITINGAPGQNVNDLADAVALRIQNMVNRKGAVYA